MKTIEIEIKNINGLHARPSASFVKISSTFESTIKISKGKEIVDGKSILDLMLLGCEKGDKLNIIADGKDEDSALEALRNLVEVEKFGEK